MIGLFNLLRNKRVVMLMVGMILFIAIVGFSLSDRKDLTMPEKLLKDTFGYAQQWLHKPAAAVSNFFGKIREIRMLYEENERLKLTAAAYSRDRAEYNFVLSENERLKEALHFTEQQKRMHDYEYMIAHVIAVSNDANSRTMNINLGSKHGIKKNMAVTTVDGLIGLVSAVSPYTSTVTPITELNETSPTFNAISVTIEGRESESFGILSHYDKETGRLVMTRIPEDDKMEIGDTVITSGFGNIYPRGLRIGIVETKQVGDFGLTFVARVKPAASFDRLTEVFVVHAPAWGDLEE